MGEQQQGPAALEDLAPSMADRRLFGLPPTVGPLELVALGIVLLIPLVGLPVVDFPNWSLKTALLLLVVGPGAVLLVDLARRGDRAAQCATAYLAWAAVSAALSARPQDAFLGGYGADRGVLVLTGYLACWAFGRRLHRDAAGPLCVVALAAVLGNVAFGLAQVVIGSDLRDLATSDGRAAGFTASSVYLGGLVAGAMGLVGALVARSTRRIVPLLVVLAVLAMGVNLTGSRIALLAGVVVAVGATVLVSPRRIVLVLAAIGLGVGLSLLVPQPGSTVGRIDAAAGSGITPRLEMWKAAGHAVAERPLVGWGPGRFRAATSPRITPAYVIGESQDKVYFDAHDVVVEQATTVGLVGLVLLLGWLALAARRARGPLAWLALGIALTWLLEPLSIATAPVAFLALGAAVPAVALPPLGRPLRAAAAILAVLGLLAAGSLLVGTRAVRDTTKTASTAALHRAERFLPSDPKLDDLAEQIAELDAREAPTAANRAAAIAAARRTATADPEQSTWWVTLGRLELEWGSPVRAQAAFDRALQRNPWSEAALAGRRRVAQERHDAPAEAAANAKLCRIRSTVCAKG